MKEEFYTYLKNIGISDVAQTKVEEIYNEILFLYNNINIDDILITNVTNDGHVEWQSLWFFNEDLVIECKNFLSQQADYDIASLNNKIIYYNIKKGNYNLNDAPRQNSYINITILINNGHSSCNLMATGANCPYVKHISQKYFLKKIDTSLYSE
ncbi:MAG: hypothetical protein KH058_05860 [Bacteroides sp.]|nr:hypothetical protein [Bacteroides sp.]MBS4825940.1 hypothetical protein [Bacteroides sp.]